MKNLILFLCLLATPAWAQNNFETPGHSRAQGFVAMCLNAQGLAVPTDQNGTCPGGGGGSETNYALETGGNLASILTGVTSSIPSGSNVIGYTSNDPCQTTAHVYKPIAIAGAATTNIVTNGTTAKIYVCQLVVATGIANNVTVIEGTTGGTCGTPAGVLGGSTTGTGFVFAANGGVSLGNGGYAIAQTATNDNDLCIITSASGPLAGGITYVIK